MFTFPINHFSLSLLFGAPDFTRSIVSPVPIGSNVSAAHSFGQNPELVVAELVCQIANNGYSVNDTIPWSEDTFIGSLLWLISR